MEFTGLELSTIHITPETATFLGRMCAQDKPTPVVVYPKDCYGWFIPIIDDGPKQTKTYFPHGWKNMPEDLQKVVQYALTKKYDWIIFDRDAEEYLALPKYEWEDRKKWR